MITFYLRIFYVIPGSIKFLKIIYIIIYVILLYVNNQNKSACWWDGCPCSFLHAESNLDEYLMLQDIQHVQCFSKLISTLILYFSAENATLHKYIVQNNKTMFRTSLEVIGNSVLILSQVKQWLFVFKIKRRSAAHTTVFKSETFWCNTVQK